MYIPKTLEEMAARADVIAIGKFVDVRLGRAIGPHNNTDPIAVRDHMSLMFEAEEVIYGPNKKMFYIERPKPPTVSIEEHKAALPYDRTLVYLTRITPEMDAGRRIAQDRGRPNGASLYELFPQGLIIEGDSGIEMPLNGEEGRFNLGSLRAGVPDPLPEHIDTPYPEIVNEPGVAIPDEFKEGNPE